MRYRKLVSLIGIGILIALLYGCSASTSPPENDSGLSPTEHSPSAKVVVVGNFGKKIFVDETVSIGENTTALDALQQVAEVKTKYGGGFVSAINGISSEYEGVKSKKKDWFFYINGMSANTGAGEYILQDGDIEYWDLRDWSFRQFVPAIIGDFPEPFLHGYKGVPYPTVIAYQDGWKEEASKIGEALSQLGIDSVSTRNADELLATEKETSNLILLGTSDFNLIEEINRPWNRLGFYCHFEESSLKVFDPGGELAAEHGAGTGVGVIQATQSIWNPKGVGACENVVWMVSGADEAGVKNAVDTLVNHYKDFKYALAAVVADGEVIKVP